MLHVALAVSLSLSAQARDIADAEAPAYYPNGQVTCDATPQSVFADSVHENLEAAPGGVFWLRVIPADNRAALILFNSAGAVLRDGAGVTTDVVTARSTSSSIAINVPDDAAAGDTFLLHVEGDPSTGIVLKVVEPRLDSPLVVSVVEDAPTASDQCFAECFEPGQVVDRAATVAVTITGAPVVVDIWEKFDGTVASPFEARLVDTRLVVPSTSDAEYTSLVAGQFHQGEIAPTLIIEIRDAHDGAILATETIEIATLADVEFTNDEGLYTDCSEYEDCCYYEDDGYYGGDCACVAVDDVHAPVAGAFALALVVGTRRRRR